MFKIQGYTKALQVKEKRCKNRAETDDGINNMKTLSSVTVWALSYSTKKRHEGAEKDSFPSTIVLF